MACTGRPGLLGLGAVAGVLAALVACTKDDAETFVRFNGADTLDVQIAPGDPGAAVSVDLFSTTGAVQVGTGSVDPGVAPAGTEHLVTVDVVDEYEEDVARVTIEADSGARGAEVFTLTRDSADHGHWSVVVQSVGRADETRTDTITFRLFTVVEGGDGDTGG